jgi:hypothetical protein
VKIVNQTGRLMGYSISDQSNDYASGVIPPNETYQYNFPPDPPSGAVPTYQVAVLVYNDSTTPGGPAPVYDVPGSGTLTVAYQVTTGLFS